MAKTWTDDEIRILEENYRSMTDTQISTLLGTHPTSGVKTKRQELGLTKDKAHRKYSFDDVIDAFSKTDYILLSDKNDYINAAENTLRYLCPKHIDKGELKISLGHLLDGRGCYFCGREVTEQAHILSSDQINKECKQICESKGFLYQGFERIDGKIYILYICPKHTDAGIQYMTKGNMNRPNIVGCPYCMDTKKYKFSKGEQEIEKYLVNQNIPYLRQYIFNDCKDINYLPFDFYLPTLNKCIEYDGQHHYKPVTFNGISIEEAEMNHKATIKHDKIKDKYCQSKNIELLRIPYYEFDNIFQLLQDFIFNERKIA